MKISLAKALIERGILNDNSRIIARCPIMSMGQMPDMKEIVLHIDRIVEEQNSISFVSTSKTTGRRYNVPCEEVLVIDGMEPERLAAAFDIKSDGRLRTLGAKRGRKPKSLLAQG